MSFETLKRTSMKIAEEIAPQNRVSRVVRFDRISFRSCPRPVLRYQPVLAVTALLPSSDDDGLAGGRFAPSTCPRGRRASHRSYNMWHGTTPPRVLSRGKFSDIMKIRFCLKGQCERKTREKEKKKRNDNAREKITHTPLQRRCVDNGRFTDRVRSRKLDSSDGNGRQGDKAQFFAHRLPFTTSIVAASLFAFRITNVRMRVCALD